MGPLYSCIATSPLPTNAIQFEVLPNACADAIRQQPADRQLECSLPNLPQHAELTHLYLHAHASGDFIGEAGADSEDLLTNGNFVIIY